jgi:hypothetical protein
VDDSQQAVLINLPPQTLSDLGVGDAVRLTALHESVPAGAEGRVVGFYRLDPPKALVAFEDGARPVLESKLERLG